MKSTRNVSGIDCMMNLDAQAEYFQYRKKKCNQAAMLMKVKYVSFYWRSWEIQRNINANPRMKDSQPIYDRAVVAFYDKRNKGSCCKIPETVKLELSFIIRAS